MAFSLRICSFRLLSFFFFLFDFYLSFYFDSNRIFTYYCFLCRKQCWWTLISLNLNCNKTSLDAWHCHSRLTLPWGVFEGSFYLSVVYFQLFLQHNTTQQEKKTKQKKVFLCLPRKLHSRKNSHFKCMASCQTFKKIRISIFFFLFFFYSPQKTLFFRNLNSNGQKKIIIKTN